MKTLLRKRVKKKDEERNLEKDYEKERKKELEGIISSTRAGRRSKKKKRIDFLEPLSFFTPLTFARTV